MKRSYVVVLWVIATVQSPRGEGWSCVSIAKWLREHRPADAVPQRQVSAVLAWYEREGWLERTTTWEIVDLKVLEEAQKRIRRDTPERALWVGIAQQYDEVKELLLRLGL